MSFMVVWVLTLIMCTLDLWGSAEGVKGTTQWTIVLRLAARLLRSWVRIPDCFEAET